MTQSLVGEIETLYDVYKSSKNKNDIKELTDIYKKNFDFVINIKSEEILPNTKSDRRFSPMDRSLRRELKSSMGNNQFWFSTTDYLELVNIRIKYKNGYFEFLVPRDRLSSSSARLFGLWISVPAVFLICVAIASP